MGDINTDIILTILDRSKLEFAGIFGSRARSDARPDSDLDLLVRFKEPLGLLKLASMQRELSLKLGVMVDLVTEGALSPFLKGEIMKDLKPIYGKR